MLCGKALARFWVLLDPRIEIPEGSMEDVAVWGESQKSIQIPQ